MHFADAPSKPGEAVVSDYNDEEVDDVADWDSAQSELVENMLGSNDWNQERPLESAEHEEENAISSTGPSTATQSSGSSMDISFLQLT